MTTPTRELLIKLSSHMAYMQGQLEAFTQQSDPEDFYWYRESVALRQKVIDALAEVGPAVPVPVSKRLPEAEDCDALGDCWWYAEEYGWELQDREHPLGECTHWLPADALPLPAEEVE